MSNQDNQPHPDPFFDEAGVLDVLAEVSEANKEPDEPFNTVLNLLAEHSELEILSAISDAALFSSEDKELCLSYRLISAKLHSELEELLNRMADFEELISKCC